MGQNISRMGQSCSNLTLSVEGDEVNGESFVIKILPKGSGVQKTVAVTGADGFIGSHIVKLLLEKGYKVRGTVLDRDKADFLNDLPRAHNNLSLFERELVEGCFDDVFVGCDCVFHVASPTLKHQREMKNPEDEMHNQAVNGTLNVLNSAQKAGVKSVVHTSSMCAATQKNPDVPSEIHTTHWANHEFLKKKGSYYAASKTLAEQAAVKFVGDMPKDSAFRLARICPAFTVGPMLQPTVNSSMERFAALCNGTHHKRIPNRSISIIDVRDTAKHHVAAYEKGIHDRVLSVTEGFHWKLFYEALKIHRPQLKSPKPLPYGTKLRPTRKYDTKLRDQLGVQHRSFNQVLEDAVREVDEKKICVGDIGCHLNSSPVDLDFEPYCGYYDLGQGRFLLIEVVCDFDSGYEVGNTVNLYYLLAGPTPTKIPVPPEAQFAEPPLKFVNGTLIWEQKLIYLKFTQAEVGIMKFSVSGRIDNTPVEGTSYGCAVPSKVLQGTFTGPEGTVEISLGNTASQIIMNNASFSESLQIPTFSYNVLKRLFSFSLSQVTYQLYLNVEAGRGLMLTLVKRFPGYGGSTNFYYLNPDPKSFPEGQVSGAADLTKFAGYYPLNSSPGSFVSIFVANAAEPVPVVGLCIDGTNSIEFTSYTFEGNSLVFPSDSDAPNLTFEHYDSTTVNGEKSIVSVDGSDVTGTNFFSSCPLTAFGTQKFTQSDGYRTLQIEEGAMRLVYTYKNTTIFDTTSFEYNPVNQHAIVGGRHLNFTYNGPTGATCAVTLNPGFEAVLYDHPLN